VRSPTRKNSDGIDILNSRDVLIQDCFLRTFDDCVSLKGYARRYYCDSGLAPVERITVRRCVLWNDWARAILIGPEAQTECFRDIRFEDLG